LPVIFNLGSKDNNRCKNILVSFPPSSGGGLANLCYGLYPSVAPTPRAFSLLIIAKVLYTGAIVVHCVSKKTSPTSLAITRESIDGFL